MFKSRKLVLAAIASVSAVMMLPTPPQASAKSTRTDVARNLTIFSEVFKELENNYVDTIDVRKTIRTAIDAMLGQIDPYTEYYDQDEQDRLASISTGEYAGIGSYITKRDTSIILSDPQWNSPARRAGIRHGDVLLSINGEPMTAKTTTDYASKHLKGQPGTDVTVTVRRPYVADSLLTFTITRGTITIEPIGYSGMVADGIGYIQVSTFNEKTAGDFAEALQRLQADKKLRGLIVDLRGNGGGLLQSSTQVASNFVPKGTDIVTIRGREARQQKTYKTTRKPIAADLPLVILVNDGTASASEILSGALQDLDRAVIVGERTYGKGLVQNSRPLPYGSVMKVTTARYYLPSGRLIQAIDYSHRDKNGNVQRIPDSLTNVFSTANGREVRDGGGITPDVKVDLPDGNSLLYALESELCFSDFANKYVNTHEAPADPVAWNESDTIFSMFCDFINPDKLKYDRATEAGIKYLRDAVKAEGYESDSLSALLGQLDTMLRHDLKRDLNINRDLISRMLDNELTMRWFSTADCLRRALPGDQYVKEAILILDDPRRYGVLLAPGKHNDAKK